MNANPLTPAEQFQCLNILDLLSDLFTGAQQETFSRVEILKILNDCKNNPELFDHDCVIAQEEITAEVEAAAVFGEPCSACGGAGCPACK